MTNFNYGEQFYQAKQNEKRKKRKQMHSIFIAYVNIYEKLNRNFERKCKKIILLCCKTSFEIKKPKSRI